MWKRVGLFIVVFLVGAVGYWLWPENDQLPDLGKIEAFTLNTAEGQSYYLDNNKLKLVTFFYTSCPDICPMTIKQISTLQPELEEAGLFGREVEFVAITFDPEVDTPARIQAYADHFQANTEGWIWLRGSVTETKRVTNMFQMIYQKQQDGSVAHGTTMYLLDENNRIRGIYDMAILDSPVDTVQILEDIKLLADK